MSDTQSAPNEWWRVPAIGATNLVPGVLANLLSPGHNPPVPTGVEPPGPVEAMIPGFPTMMYNMAHSIGELTNDATGGRVGWSLPGGDRAGQLYDMSVADARRLVPHMEPTPGNRLEEGAQAVGTSAGSAVFPGGLLRNAADMAVAGGITGGVHAYAAAHADDAPHDKDHAPEVLQLPEVLTLPEQHDVSPTTAQSTAPASIDQKIDYYAAKHGVPPLLAHTFINQESGGRNGLTSSQGAQGLGQLMPGTAKGLGVTNTWDADQNLDASMRYIRKGMDATGTVEGTARYYYGGPDTAQWGPRTQAYARQIGDKWAQLSQQNTPQELTLPEVLQLPEQPKGWDDWLSDAVKYVGGGAVLLGAAVGGGVAARSIARAVRDGMDARAGNAFTADQAARLAGNLPLDSPVVPGPVPNQSILGKVQGGLQDSTAPLKRVIDSISPSPTVAQDLRDHASLAHNNTSVNERVTSIMESGYDPVSKTQFPSPLELRNRVDALDPATDSLYNRTAWARDEMDNRVKLFDDAATRGVVLPDEQLRVKFATYDSAQLRTIINDGLSNPIVKDLLDTRELINRGRMDAAVARGFITADDRNALMKVHPNHVASTDMDGTVLHPFDSRNYEPHSGPEAIPIHVKEVDAQKDYMFWKAMDANDFKAHYYDTHFDFLNNNPAAPKVIRLSKGPPNATGTQPFINSTTAKHIDMVRRGGQLQQIEHLSPDLHAMLQQDPYTTSAVMTALNRTKNGMQSLTTGPASLLAGNVFALKQFLYSMVTTSAIRPKGISTGLLDAGTRKLTGGRVGLPGDVAGTGVGMSYAVAADAAAKGAKLISAMLHKDNPGTANQILRAVLGDSAVDAMATRAGVVFKGSVLNQRQELGLTNTGSYASRELPTNRVGATGAQLYNPMNTLTHRNLTDIPVLHQGQSLLFKTADFVKGIHELLSDAASSHVYRLNTGQFPGMAWARSPHSDLHVGVVSRDIMGDPGVRGSNKWVRSYADAVPYGNIAIQDVSRLIRGFAENPGGTVAGLTLSLGSLAAASLLSAMQYGPEALAHMEHEMSTGTQAGGFVIYPSRDSGLSVDQHTFVAASQRERMFIPVFKSLLHDGLDALKAYTDPDSHMTLKDTLVQFLGKHFTRDTAVKTIAGASSALSPGVPPLVEAGVAALTQKELTPTLDRMIGPDNSARPLLDRMSVPVGGGNPGGPNVDRGGDSVFGSTSVNIMSHVLSSLLGVGGQFIAHALESTGDQLRWGHSGTEAAINVAQLYKQGLTDRNPQLNSVWDSQLAISKSNPQSDEIHNKLNAIKPTLTDLGDAAHPDQTRAGGPVRVQPPGEVKGPTDPFMRNLYDITAGFGKSINGPPMQQVHDAEKAIYDNQHSGMSPVAIRQENNRLVRDYNVRMAAVGAMLDVLEKELSRNVSELTGKPAHVRVENIDWSKGPVQFH